jgi:hypothetical protein
MELQECFDLMRDIRKAQKDVTTPVGVCKSLQDHMDKEAIKNGQERNGIVSIGEYLPDGRYALYATFPNRIVPKEWHGFPVINTTEAWK